MSHDAELLRCYAEKDDQTAFAEFVGRHIDFVYASALRQGHGDGALAADAVQVVFSDAARKADELAEHAVVIGWLHTATRFAVAKAIRGEARRHAREHEAWTMKELSRDDAPAADWMQLQPVLDDVLGELKERERAAILLRFFEKRPLAEVGAKLALSETAARSCVDRALDRMRERLVRRGITSTGAALGLALANQVSVAAPVGLAATVTSMAVAGATAAGGMSALGAFFIMSKIKVGIVSVIVLAGLTTAVVEVRANRALRAELQTGVSGRALEDSIARLQRENQQLTVTVKELGEKNPEIGELMRLRNRMAELQARPAGVVDEEIRAPRNLGRATPAAAVETFSWAIDQDDLDLVGPFITFRDDTPENRAAFMAKFSPAVQARYRTPERLCAAAFFRVGSRPPDPNVALQVVSVEEDHGPDQVKIQLWWRTASGKESGGRSTWLRGPNGWGERPVTLLEPNILNAVLSQFDPATGALLPPPAAKP